MLGVNLGLQERWFDPRVSSSQYQFMQKPGCEEGVRRFVRNQLFSLSLKGESIIHVISYH